MRICNWRMFVVSVFVGVMVFAVSSLSIAVDTPGYGDDGSALFESKCGLCHSIDRPKSKKKSEEGWRKTVMRMKNVNKCPISDEEATAIIKYLSKTYSK